MASRKRSAVPDHEQLELFTLGQPTRVKRGVDTAIRAACNAGFIDAHLDAGFIGLARSLASAVDTASRAGGDGWLLARLTGELREALSALRLSPASRGDREKDSFDEFLASLATPETGSPPLGNPTDRPA